MSISKASVTFSAKIFGFVTKKSLSYYEIQEAYEEEENSNVLKIIYQKYPKNKISHLEYIMKNNNELQRSIQTICSLIQKRSANNEEENPNSNSQAEEGDPNNFFALRTKDWSLLLDTAQRL